MHYSLEIVLLAFVFGFLLGAIFGYGLALISNPASREQSPVQKDSEDPLDDRTSYQTSFTDIRDESEILAHRIAEVDGTLTLPVIGKLENAVSEGDATLRRRIPQPRVDLREPEMAQPSLLESTQDLSAEIHAPYSSLSEEAHEPKNSDNEEEVTRLFETPKNDRG